MATIIGLGNCGIKYDKSRHNVGFMCLDTIAKKNNIVFKKKFFRPYYFSKFNNIKLIKPITYMNNSGKVLSYLKKDEPLVVVVDNMDLDIGVIRLKKSSKKSSHNGLRSINKYLDKDKSYYIMHIGIGKPSNKEDIIDYVLSKEVGDKALLLQESCDLAAIILNNLDKKDIESLSGTYKCGKGY